MTSYTAAAKEIRALGFRVSKDIDGEIRVAWPGNESAAYYTNDVEDALGTARHMATENTPESDAEGEAVERGEHVPGEPFEAETTAATNPAKPFDAMHALQAMKARIAGQFDSIPLQAFGPLSGDIRADLSAMVESAIAAVNIEAENTACLWEAVIDARGVLYAGQGGLRIARPDWVADLDSAFDAHGSCAMRSDVAGLAGYAEAGWRAAQESGFDSPFDWEFCPWFIAACVDWSTGPDIRAGYLDLCRAMGAADGQHGGAAITALDALNLN